MTDRSQYLAQALQGMGQPAAQPQTPRMGMTLGAMQNMLKQRQAFEQANPGQSYAAHGLQQMGQQMMQAPQAIAAAPGNVAKGIGGLFNLPWLQAKGGQTQAPATYPAVPRGADGQPLLGNLGG